MDLNLEIEKLQEGQQKILQLISDLRNHNPKAIAVYAIDDLSKLFKVTRRTIYNWKEAGLLSFEQIGSKTYVTEKQLHDFLSKHEVKSFKVGRI